MISFSVPWRSLEFSIIYFFLNNKRAVNLHTISDFWIQIHLNIDLDLDLEMNVDSDKDSICIRILEDLLTW